MVAAVAFCEMNDERLILALVEADEFRVPLLHHGCAKRLGIRSVPSLIRLANQKYVPPGIVNWGYSEMANAAEFAELSSAIASTLGTDMPPIAPGPNGLTDAWKEMLRKSPVLKQLRDLEK
jgi:hypothetical protein